MKKRMKMMALVLSAALMVSSVRLDTVAAEIIVPGKTEEQAEVPEAEERQADDKTEEEKEMLMADETYTDDDNQNDIQDIKSGFDETAETEVQEGTQFETIETEPHEETQTETVTSESQEELQTEITEKETPEEPQEAVAEKETSEEVQTENTKEKVPEEVQAENTEEVPEDLQIKNTEEKVSEEVQTENTEEEASEEVQTENIEEEVPEEPQTENTEEEVPEELQAESIEENLQEKILENAYIMQQNSEEKTFVNDMDNEKEFALQDGSTDITSGKFGAVLAYVTFPEEMESINDEDYVKILNPRITGAVGSANTYFKNLRIDAENREGNTVTRYQLVGDVKAETPIATYTVTMTAGGKSDTATFAVVEKGIESLKIKGIPSVVSSEKKVNIKPILEINGDTTGKNQTTTPKNKKMVWEIVSVEGKTMPSSLKINRQNGAVTVSEGDNGSFRIKAVTTDSKYTDDEGVKRHFIVDGKSILFSTV